MQTRALSGLCSAEESLRASELYGGSERRDMGLMTGGKGGGKNALAAKPNLLNALRVQTSSYGQVVPIVYGQNRISGRLIWSGDFTAIPHTSTQKVGGKGL